MNKKRREWLGNVIDALELQKEQLEEIRDEEQDCYDSLTENLQCTERGEMMEENVDDLDSAISDLEDVISSIQEIYEDEYL